MNRNEHLYALDCLRVLCAAAVAVYHIKPELFPGGYLAVCVFLVMHGFLFVVSAEGTENFSVLKYWRHRFVRLYLPVLFVVCLTMLGLKYLPDVIWLNKKPETLSVLYGTNNWWQINAGQSYFARLGVSPFTHMWYISMILQIELVLPLLYKLLRLCGKKAAGMTLLVLAVISFYVMPYYSFKGLPLMRIYFGTDARVFSLLAGMSLGFLKKKDARPGSRILRDGWNSDLLFVIFTAALGVMFFKESENSLLYEESFILATLMGTGAVLVCADPAYPVNRHLHLSLLRLLGAMSYEVYLVHYPLLYLGTASGYLKEGQGYGWYALCVLVLSCMIHGLFSLMLQKRKPGWTGFWRTACLFPVLIVCLTGGYEVIKAKDHTEEMARLEEQLAQNAKLQEESREEYLRKREEEYAFFNDPAAMAQDVGAHNLPVTCLGDSVMLGAYTDLRNTFPNGDVDAAVSRAHFPILDLCLKRSANGTLGNPVVINCGANGYIPMEYARRIIDACGDRKVYWLTATNRWQVDNREVLFAADAEYDNMRVLDWETFSEGHNNWFYSDGLHLTPEGRKAYTGFIFDAIVSDLIEEKYAGYEEKRVLALGDGFLLGAVSQLEERFEDLYVIAEEEPDLEEVKAQVIALKEHGVLPGRVVIGLGNKESYTEEQVHALLKELEGTEVLLIRMPLMRSGASSVLSFTNELAVQVVSIENWYYDHPEFVAPDRVHFTAEGEKAFAELVAEQLSDETDDAMQL